MRKSNHLAESIVSFIHTFIFFAMVPFMPITVWLMYLGMEKLGF